MPSFYFLANARSITFFLYLCTPIIDLSMNRAPLILALACIAIVVLLYTFGERQKPLAATSTSPDAPFAQGGNPAAMAAAMAQSSSDMPLVGIDIERITGNIKQKLSPAERKTIEQAEAKFAQAPNNPNAQAQAAAQLAKVWEQVNYIEVAAFYHKKVAEADSTADNWQHAADQLALAFKIAQDSTMFAYLLQNAVKAYEKTLAIDSTRTDAAINLASCYIEGYPDQTPLVMKGVFLLRGVTAKDSTNAAAYLVLGKAAITSGQYDRAVERLERATRYAPSNAEAYYFLAEAYQAVGNKAKAIKALQECKNLTKNPTFAREIDQIILNLQKP